MKTSLGEAFLTDEPGATQGIVLSWAEYQALEQPGSFTQGMLIGLAGSGAFALAAAGFWLLGVLW